MPGFIPRVIRRLDVSLLRADERAALILVFGQPTHEVVALQWKDITIYDRAQAITLGEHLVILEHPLDELVVAHIATRAAVREAGPALGTPTHRPRARLTRGDNCGQRQRRVHTRPTTRDQHTPH